MKRTLILLALLLPLALFAQTKDYTAKVKNTAAAWGGTGTYTAGDITCAEYYAAGHFYQGTFAQTVTGLPVGVYEAEVYFNASCAAWECAEVCADGTTGRTHFFINDAELDVPIYNVKEITAPTLYTLQGIHVSDGTLRLGARNDREGANWHLVRLKSLRYLGPDARSLYDAQFPLVRQARQVLDACTCPAYAELLRQAIDASSAASLDDSQEWLQTLYDNITGAMQEATAFESRKTTTLKNIGTRLSLFQRNWNSGTRSVNDEQWGILLPAVQQLCEAKDDECDLDAMESARTALTQAMTEATGITSLSPTHDPLPMTLFTLDGRPAVPAAKGLLIGQGRKTVK